MTTVSCNSLTSYNRSIMRVAFCLRNSNFLNDEHPLTHPWLQACWGTLFSEFATSVFFCQSSFRWYCMLISFLFQPTNIQRYIYHNSISLYNIHSYVFRHLCHSQGVLHLCLAKVHKLLKLNLLKNTQRMT